MLRSSCPIVSAQVERIGEVLVVRLAGVVTAKTVEIVFPAINEALLERDARALVINLQGAVIALTDVGWNLMKEAACGAQMVHPAALVVSSPFEKEARAYCRDMAERGFVRGPFIGEPAAIVWASRCREHWPHRPPGLDQPAPPPPRGWRSPHPEQSAHMPLA